MSINYILIPLLLSIISLSINLIHQTFKKNSHIIRKLKYISTFLTLLSFSIFIYYFIPLIDNIITSQLELSSQYILILEINFLIISNIVNITIFIFTLLKQNNIFKDLMIPTRQQCKSGILEIGRVFNFKRKFLLSLKDIEKHVFICGATGTGKTNFLQNFLLNFSKYCKIPFFLVEFKGEYHFLQEKIENMVILRPGKNFSINLFDPGTSDPTIHAERIFDILKSGKMFEDSSGEYSPQMEKVFIEILVRVCKDEDMRDWNGFETHCKKYSLENNKKIPMLSQTLISIENRIRRYSKGPLKALFEKRNNIDILELFNNKILLDLSSIIKLGGDKQDIFFFLNMILKYLWDINLSRGASEYSGIKHVTIVEDAQYFASQGLAKSKRITTYLEDIALLQRGTGECLITLATRPDISEEILANCGVLVSFKNHLERNYLCKLLGLNSEHEEYFSLLEEGQCIARVSSLKEPFLLNIPYIPRKAHNDQTIKNNNKIIQKMQFFSQKNGINEPYTKRESDLKIILEHSKFRNDLDQLKAKVLELFNNQKQ